MMVSFSPIAILPDLGPAQQLLLPFPPRLVSATFSIELPPRRASLPARPSQALQLDLLGYRPILLRVRRLVAHLSASQANLSAAEDQEIRSLLAEDLGPLRVGLVSALVFRLDRLLVSEARRMVGDTDELEDFAQEARLLAVLALNNPKRDDRRPIKPYLLGVLRRGLARTHNTTHRIIRIPERQLRRVYRLWKMVSRAEAAQMSVREISESLTISREKARNVQVALAAIGTGPTLSDGEDQTDIAFRSEVTPESLLVKNETMIGDHRSFQEALSDLPRAHRNLLAARFPPGAEARTIAGAARTVGISLNLARQQFSEIRTILGEGGQLALLLS